MEIRRIERSDNSNLSKLIKGVFEEFNIAREGTVYTDPTTDDLYSLFSIDNAAYWVAEQNGMILGGCGIFPTEGLPDGYLELVKFYVSPSSRGLGIGKLLIQKSIETAKALGYKNLYLESFPELKKAVLLYKKIGFIDLEKKLGNSGHYACTIWMKLKLES